MATKGNILMALALMPSQRNMLVEDIEKWQN